MCATNMISASLKKSKDEKHTQAARLQAGGKRDLHQRHVTLAVWHDKHKAEFKMLKDNDNVEDKYVEAGNTWYLENAT